MTELDALKVEAEALINDSLVEKLIVFQDKLVKFWSTTRVLQTRVQPTVERSSHPHSEQHVFDRQST